MILNMQSKDLKVRAKKSNDLYSKRREYYVSPLIFYWSKISVTESHVRVPQRTFNIIYDIN